MQKQKTASIRNRVFSFISAAIIGLNSIPMMSFTTANAAASASNSSLVQFPLATSDAESAMLNHDDTLVDNDDGTFTFTSKITSSYSYSDLSESRMQFKDGYYKLEKVGKYLIELWGGDGGDGGRALFSGRSGVGGSGGFVYGILEVTDSNDLLNKYLVYEIGSKGESTTFDVNGGGTAGDGGGAGDITFVSIGAGGGYSAVYISNNEKIGNGEDKNLKETTEYHTFRDNPQNVLMIAGGGGGGAAGANGAHLTALFLKMHGDGGDGGSEESSISGPVSLEESNLYGKGTYYAGANGTSSGGQTRYVGQGGTDRPEGHATTFLGGMEASTYANDWQMTYHPDLGRGVGGAGNLHGGGGGAGFAGGGGGIQNVIVDANNVGGGGGGSSFISNQFSDFTAFAKPTDTQYFVKKEDNTNKEIGGAIVIRYLPPNNKYDYLEGVKISGEVSEYFDIVSASCFESKTNNSSDVKPASGNTITFSGSVAPVTSGLEMGQANDSLTLTLRLKPKAAFAGGNNVPIFTTDPFKCYTTVSDYIDTSQTDPDEQTDKKCSYTYADDVSYVNVPLNLDLKVNNLIKNPTDSYTKTDLYEAATNAPSVFITSVDTPTVGNFTGDSIDLTDDDIDQIKTHDITVHVTLASDGANAVGDPCGTTFTRTATVKCVAQGTLYVDGFEIKPKKSLSYNSADQTYDFDVDMKVKLQDAYKKQLEAYPPSAVGTPTYYKSNVTNKSLTPGVYYIEVWGGDGGNAGNNGGINNNNKGNGGIGGKGGYVSGYLKVDTAKTLNITIGTVGANGEGWLGFIANPTNGKKGTATTVSIGDDEIIAGGGGGGGVPYTWYAKSNGKTSDDRFFHGLYGLNGGESPLPASSVYDGEDGLNDKSPSQSEAEPTHAKGGNNDDSALSSSLLDACGADADNIIDVSKATRTIERSTTQRTWTSSTIGLFTNWSASEYTISRNVTYSNTTESQSYLETGNNGNGYVKITKLGLKGYIGSQSYSTVLAYNNDLPIKTSAMESTMESYYTTNGFTIGETFSQYFKVDGSCEKTPSSENLSITTTVVDGRLDCKLNVTSTTSALVTTATTQTSTSPVAGYSVNKTIYSYGLKDVNIGVRVHLKPQDNFLGGNDVPLLDKALNENNTDTPTKRAVQIEHKDTKTPNVDIGYVAPLPETDYANVEIDSSGAAWNVPSYDVYVPYGTTVNKTSLGITSSSLIDPTTGKTWEQEYVTFAETPPPVLVEPTDGAAWGDPITKDASYKLSASLSPKYPNDTDHTSLSAVVREKMSAKNISVVINAHVLYSLTQNLTGLSSDKPDNDEFTIDDVEENYVVELTADPGYKVTNDSSVTVLIGNVDITSAASIIRDTVNGKITVSIPKAQITNNITITASAAEQPHKVYYFFETYDPISGPTQGILNGQRVEEYQNGDTIAASAEIESKQNSIYTPSDYPDPYKLYEWTWSIGTNANGDYVMGNSDVYVFGAFKQPAAKLKIYYSSSDEPDTFNSRIGGRTPYISGDPNTDPYGIPLTVGSTYYVTSPDVEGYYTDTPVVKGTVISTDDIEKYVTYYKTTENLIIYLIKCDKDGIPLGETTTPVFSKTDVSEIQGYHIFDVTQYKRDTANGTTQYCEESIGSVANIGDSGTYYVYYREDYTDSDKKTITFNCDPPAGSTASPSGVLTRTVVIGREYSYNKGNGSTEDFGYNGMPTVRCSDYTFIGWADSAGNIVNDEDIVTDESPTVLYAQWESAFITISIDYKYAYTINTNVESPKTPGAVISDAEFDTVNGPEPVKQKTVRKGMAYKIGTADTNTIIVPAYLQDNSYRTDTYISDVALKPQTHEIFYSNNVPPTDVKLTVNVYSETYKDVDGSLKLGSPKLIGGTFMIYDMNDTQIGSAKINSDGYVSWSASDSSITSGGSYKVVCTDPPTGYGTAEITVILNDSSLTGTNQYTANIFLGKSPFQLPMAGGRPLTGYTVCGISTMLLAAFLLFLYVSSKSEEKENE